jgi:hypothetical protein
MILKTTALLAAPGAESREGEDAALTPAQAILRKLVLDSVASVHSKRNYAKALDDLFWFLCQPTSLPRAADGVAGCHGVSLAIHYKRPALGCPQVSDE